jgi:hypothetical protein
MGNNDNLSIVKQGIEELVYEEKILVLDLLY